MPDPRDDTAALREAMALLNRGNDVRDWPEDEQELHRSPIWRSFSERHEAVLRLRAEKLLALAAGERDDERFCGVCLAGIDSSEHHEKCVRPLDLAEDENARLAAAQAIHEAHTTMTYSLADIANGDTGSLDPKDCPVCTSAPDQEADRG